MKKSIQSRLLAASAVLSVVLAYCALERPAFSQATIGPITQTFSSAGSAPIVACSLKGENSATFQSAGAGPIDAQISNDGVSWTAATITDLSGNSKAQPFTPTAGTTYQITPLNADCIRIVPDSTWGAQNAVITFKASNSVAYQPPAVISSLPPVQLVTPVPVTQSSVPWNVQCTSAANCPVNVAQIGANAIAATASPNAGAALPMLPVAPCANNAATTNCAGITAGQNLQVVQNAAPQATTPISCAAATNCPVNDNQVTSPWVVSTPSSGPAPTASTGAAYPANAPYIFDFPSCEFTSGTINVTTQFAIPLQCTALGLLRVNVGNVVTTANATANPSFPPNALANVIYPNGATQIPGLPVGCNHEFTTATSSATATTQAVLIAASQAGQSQYFCGYQLQLNPAAGINVALSSSASNSCTTPTTVHNMYASSTTASSGAVQPALAPTWYGIGGSQPFLGLASCLIITVPSGTPYAINMFYSQGTPGP